MVTEDVGGEDGIGRMSLDPDTAHSSRSCMASSSSSSSSSSSLSSSLRSSTPLTGTHRALAPSLFSHMPPTVNFVLEGQKREPFNHHAHSAVILLLGRIAVLCIQMQLELLLM